MLEGIPEHPPRTPAYLVAGRPIDAAPVAAGPAGLLHAQVVEVGPELLDAANTKNTTDRGGQSRRGGTTAAGRRSRRDGRSRGVTATRLAR